MFFNDDSTVPIFTLTTSDKRLPFKASTSSQNIIPSLKPKEELTKRQEGVLKEFTQYIKDWCFYWFNECLLIA